MPLTEEQAFKVGFLQKCAEDGLTIEETKQRVKAALLALKNPLEKQALPWFLAPAAYLGGKGIDLATRIGTSVIPPALSAIGTAGVLGPIIGGAGAGYLAAKATSSDKNLVDEAKHEELIGEYDRLADEAKRRARLKQLQSLTGRRVIALTPGE